LTQLDKLVGSLQIDGMPPTGLQNTVWQWLGTTWYEQAGTVQKQNPIADPTLYEVIYGPDGVVEIKADCNRASGVYTYEGGMVGSVRVGTGPMTLAACAPGSRSQEFIESLLAAQDFRVQPTGEQLRLNLPAGGPVLYFRNAGSATP
jgi:heat shock protein HslJ